MRSHTRTHTRTGLLVMASNGGYSLSLGLLECFYASATATLKWITNQLSTTTTTTLIIIATPPYIASAQTTLKTHFQQFPPCCMHVLPNDGSGNVSYLQSSCLAMDVVSLLISWSLPGNVNMSQNYSHTRNWTPLASRAEEWLPGHRCANVFFSPQIKHLQQPIWQY
jgi:hypothetical protein